MLKHSLYSAFLLVSILTSAQNTKEQLLVKQTISTFFKALHTGDSTLMKTTLHKTLKVQTIGYKKTTPLLATNTTAQLLKAVASKKAGVTYLEKLLSYTIKIDGHLASVWTPYRFYINNTFSHCGSNSFQLIKENNTWQILFLIDIRKRENCINNTK